MKRRYWLLLAWLVCIRVAGYAGDSTAVYSARTVAYTDAGYFYADSLQWMPIDTSLADFQYTNLLDNKREPYLSAGNTGLAYRSLLFKPDTGIGFDAGLHYFDAYRFNPFTTNYYQTRSPYTNLHYINGRLKEQVFNLTFSENIKPYWNMGFDFNRIASIGDFQRQKSDHLGLNVFTSVHSRNQRYQLYLNGIFNRLRAQENGGLANDSIFEVSSSIPIEFEPVRLANAEREWKEKGFYIRQTFGLGRNRIIKKDSLELKRAVPSHRLEHSLNYRERAFGYTDKDADSAYYLQIETDTSFMPAPEIADKGTERLIQNEFNYAVLGTFLQNDSLRHRSWKMNTGLLHEFIEYRQGAIALDTFNLLAKTALHWELASALALDAKASKALEGYNKEDYNWSTALSLGLNRQGGKLVLQYRQSKKKPAFSFFNYQSAFVNWNLGLAPVYADSWSGILQFPSIKFDISLSYSSISNYTYLIASQHAIKPVQASETQHISTLILTKNFNLWRLGMDNKLIYQLPANAAIIRVPAWYSNQSLYYESRRIKEVLTLRAGIDLRYHSGYEGYEYNPETAFFYQDGKPIAAYPLMDVFISAGLKRARLLLKIDHLNQSWVEKGYYSTNAYPMPGRSVKLGVNWRFYD